MINTAYNAISGCSRPTCPNTTQSRGFLSNSMRVLKGEAGSVRISIEHCEAVARVVVSRVYA